MKFTYTPHGVCSREILIDIEDGIVKELSFNGGCHGNLQGVSALVVGRKAEEVIPLLRGIDCRGKGTSCPDQLSAALEAALEAERSV